MNVTTYITKEYENISNWALYENEPKTNPNKPNFKGKIMMLSTFLLWDLVRIIMLFKSLSGKYRLKIILEVYPIIW